MTREEAIKELRDASDSEVRYGDTENHYNEVLKRIEALDMAIKALKQTRWIPVSERLPKENGFYLATYDGEICGENEPFTGLAEYENGKWVDDEEDYQCVLAWMPLPEPYVPKINVGGMAESEDKGCK